MSTQVARARPHLSTAETLTLVTVGVVVAVLATALTVIWLTLRNAAINTAQDRVNRSVHQLATVSATTVRQSQARYEAVARDSGVRLALARTPTGKAELNAIEEELRKLPLPTDSGLPVELWSASGKRIAFIGNNLEEPANRANPSESGAIAVPAHQGLDQIVPHDSLQFGKLYRANGRTFFWVVMPVVVDGSLRGYIAQQRRIAANPTAEQTIRELGGNSVAGYYRNTDGSAWTSFGGAPAEPLGDDNGDGRVRPGVGPMIFAEEHIEGTPLVLDMEAPRAAVVGGAMVTVRNLGALSAILTIVGALIAWTIGRRVARPLVRLTHAAEAVAQGDYSTRVSTSGSEEVSLLANTFNRMAGQIADMRSGLEEAKTAAEAGSRAKSDFLAAMSHELRTPLNAIGGYAELIDMGLRGPVSDEQRRDLARIRASQQHLLGLIGGVLDLSRIESGRVTYDLASVAVDPFLEGLEALVLPQAAAKQQTFTYVPSAGMLAVLADREKLRQIMLNLLSNAIRHSPAGASITVSARTADVVELSVCDTGPGIPAERHESIFEPFVQLDRSFTARSEGIGLGLAISRDLARGMGGDITVTSVVGEGACFVVTLPIGSFDKRTLMTGTTETPVQARAISS
ncbi:MAG: HAMP domain-containing sensor histidine kinase [Gemmatimonadaceae bacterium]